MTNRALVTPATAGLPNLMRIRRERRADGRPARTAEVPASATMASFGRHAIRSAEGWRRTNSAASAPGVFAGCDAQHGSAREAGDRRICSRTDRRRARCRMAVARGGSRSSAMRWWHTYDRSAVTRGRRVESSPISRLACRAVRRRGSSSDGGRSPAAVVDGDCRASSHGRRLPMDWALHAPCHGAPAVRARGSSFTWAVRCERSRNQSAPRGAVPYVLVVQPTDSTEPRSRGTAVGLLPRQRLRTVCAAHRASIERFTPGFRTASTIDT
jgi:hypothetical protein